MDLRNYPFDEQVCSIQVGIFGFFDYQLILKWGNSEILRPPYFTSADPFSVNPEIAMPNYHLVNSTYGFKRDTKLFEGSKHCQHPTLADQTLTTF